MPLTESAMLTQVYLPLYSSKFSFRLRFNVLPVIASLKTTAMYLISTNKHRPNRTDDNVAIVTTASKEFAMHAT